MVRCKSTFVNFQPTFVFSSSTGQKDSSKPYLPTPGARSTKLDEISSVAWNRQVQYVLAGAVVPAVQVILSSGIYCGLWGKWEVVALAYGGGQGTGMLACRVDSGMAVGPLEDSEACQWDMGWVILLASGIPTSHYWASLVLAYIFFK